MGAEINRPVQNYETISSGLIFIEVQPQKKQKENETEEILQENMAENFPEIMKEIK